LRNGPCYDLLVKLPEIFDTPPAARDHNHIHRRKPASASIAELPNRPCNLQTSSATLNADRIDEDLNSWLAAMKNLEKVANGRARRRGDQSQPSRKARQRTLARGFEKSFSGQLALKRLELGLECASAARLHHPNDHLVLPAWLVERNEAKNRHALSARERDPVQASGGPAEEHAVKLTAIMLQ